MNMSCGLLQELAWFIISSGVIILYCRCVGNTKTYNYNYDNYNDPGSGLLLHTQSPVPPGDLLAVAEGRDLQSSPVQPSTVHHPSPAQPSPVHPIQSSAGNHTEQLHDSGSGAGSEVMLLTINFIISYRL